MQIATAGTMNFTAGAFLCYDFDDGTAAHDAFGQLFGIHNLGLGNAEGEDAHGDSGGPAFLPNGQIAGIVDFGFAPTVSSVVLGNSDFIGFGGVNFNTNVAYYANWLNSIIGSSAATGEFLVNQTTGGYRKWSSVATDAQGDFVVTWTSYGQDGGGNGYGAGYNGQNGVYARRYNEDTTPASNEFLVNTYTAKNQQHSSVAMDSAGDFTITWESYQERQQNTGGTNSSVPVNYGIYAQQYARTSALATNSSLGPNGQIGGEINVTPTRSPRRPAINGIQALPWTTRAISSSTGSARPRRPVPKACSCSGSTSRATRPARSSARSSTRRRPRRTL